MNFRNFRLSGFLPNLIIAMAYPAIRAVSSGSNRLLHLVNAMTIIGLVMIILGVLYNLVLKGDFDITRFIADRALRHTQKDYKAYKEDRDDERESSFNYPLFVGILLIAASIVLSRFC